MSRNKHHMLYYYSRWCGSPEGTAINRMNRRMSLERGRHSPGEGGGSREMPTASAPLPDIEEEPKS